MVISLLKPNFSRLEDNASITGTDIKDALLEETLILAAQLQDLEDKIKQTKNCYDKTMNNFEEVPETNSLGRDFWRLILEEYHTEWITLADKKSKLLEKIKGYARLYEEIIRQPY